MRSRGLRDEGKASCPSSESRERLEYQECNEKKCDDKNDHVCSGDPLDVVLLMDASGSMTQEGFNAVRDLTKELVHDFSLSESATKLSIATFAKEVTVVSGLTTDANDLKSKLDSVQWLKGPSNAGVSLSRAASLLVEGGRKTASSLVLMVTDGRLVDPFLAQQAAARLKKNGVRLAFALADASRVPPLLKSLASKPEKDNIIQIPGFKQLPTFLKWTSKRIITSTCSSIA